MIAAFVATLPDRLRRALGARDYDCGLPDRAAFIRLLQRRLQHEGTQGQLASLLRVDLEGLRECNDELGSTLGDRLVAAAAGRFRLTLTTGDVLARIGGDEFAILLAPSPNRGRAMEVAKGIVAAMHRPFDLPGGSIQASVSVGIADVEPCGCADPAMRAADAALRRAKARGRPTGNGCIERFEAGRDMPAQPHSLAPALRAALERDEFVLHYQPIVASDTLQIRGVEALLRWQHPARGLLQPDVFIAQAESCGLIPAIGAWVLRRACDDARAWSNLHVAVNVSATQFRHAGFRDTVVTILADTGFDPSRLELELTESIVIDDADEAETCLIELRSMGVRLALDDFGTGYSSLLYLRRFAFDKIKIDRSFVQSLEAQGESAVIVGSVVGLGQALGLTVVAEGVETPAQQAHLQALGCEELQGYLYAPPVPAAEITAMVTPLGRVDATAAA